MFQLLKTEGKARRGVFTCAHGTVQTPVFMNVGTQGAIKGALSAADLKAIGCQVELSNTYHLHLRPGDRLVHDLGGLHRFMTWDGPILTDSGGFQVFSLASLRRIKEEGVYFASHIDGHKIFMGPEESMQIQSNLGSDICMAFDECIENPAPYDYVARSVDRTYRWLVRCKAENARLNALPDTVNPQQMLWGINQGGTYADLRIRHMQQIAELDLPGYAIGGLAVGESTQTMYDIIDAVEPYMPKDKTRYLMGVGTLQPLGPTASLAIGKWFMPLGWRISGFGGFHYTFNSDNFKSEEVYGGGRAEVLVNLNTLISPSVDDPRLEVNLSAGYEFGALAHRSSDYAKKLRTFHGPTGSMQLVYFLSDQIGITGEARYSKSFYTQPFKSGITQDRHMQNVGVMFGVQYRRRKADFDAKRGFFQPYNFAYATVGTNFPMRTAGVKMKDIPDMLGQQISLGVGRQYTPLSAVRGSIEIGRYAYQHGGVYPLSVTADYMLNLTNMIGNYSENRIFDLNAFAGIVYTHHEMEDKNYFGIQGGLQQSFKLNDRWNIFAEEYLRGYNGKITPSARTYTSGEYTFVLGASIGTSYRF